MGNRYGAGKWRNASAESRFGFFCVCLVIALICASAILSVAGQRVQLFAQAETSSGSSVKIPNVQFQNRTVYTAIWLINIYSFEYKTGTYTFDMYIYYFWIDPNISTIDWYLMNGYPAYAGAKLLVEKNQSGPVQWEIYRVRAILNTPLESKGYPFDHIVLPVSIEMLTHGYDSTLAWLSQDTGIDIDYKNVGWSTPTFDLLTSTREVYPFGSGTPRIDMNIHQYRAVAVGFIETIVPPIIFCIVSAFSFWFRMDDSTALGLRVGLNTSMLITAVLFYLSEVNNIPPVSTLTFYTAFIISVLSFLAMNLIITILGYVRWAYHKRTSEHIDRINRWGLLASFVLPVSLFLILIFLVGS